MTQELARVGARAITFRGPAGSGKTAVAAATYEEARAAGSALIMLEADRFAPMIEGEHDVFMSGSYHQALYRSAACFIAGTGSTVIVDGLEPYGNQSYQDEFNEAFKDLDVVRIGVTCSSETLIERSRAKRIIVDHAVDQLKRIHSGESYDLMIDTDAISASEAARRILSVINEEYSEADRT